MLWFVVTQNNYLPNTYSVRGLNNSRATSCEPSTRPRSKGYPVYISGVELTLFKHERKHFPSPCNIILMHHHADRD